MGAKCARLAGTGARLASSGGSVPTIARPFRRARPRRPAARSPSHPFTIISVLMPPVPDLLQSLFQLREHIAPWGDERTNETLDQLQAQLEAFAPAVAPVPDDEQKRLAALYQVSHALGSSLDLNEVLHQV